MIEKTYYCQDCCHIVYLSALLVGHVREDIISNNSLAEKSEPSTAIIDGKISITININYNKKADSMDNPTPLRGLFRLEMAFSAGNHFQNLSLCHTDFYK